MPATMLILFPGLRLRSCKLALKRMSPVASSVSMTPQMGHAIWPTTAQLTADVQNWLELPAANHGWLLKTDEFGPVEVRRFESRENVLPFDLTVRHPEYVSIRCLDLNPGQSFFELVLERGETVSGFVVDPEGRPVAGASVLSGPVYHPELAIFSGPQRGLPQEGVNSSHCLDPETSTLPDGSFHLTGISAGEFSLRAVPPPWAPSLPQNLRRGFDGVQLFLEPGATVEGRVIDGRGRPIAGADVAVVDGNPPHPRTQSNQNGFFQLQGVEAGTELLSAVAPGFAAQGKRLCTVLIAGERRTGVELIALRSPVVTGRVVDESGLPIEGVSVGHERENRKGLPIVMPQDPVFTDNDGRFHLENIAVPNDPAFVSITLEHDRYEAPDRDLEAFAPFPLTAREFRDLGDLPLRRAKVFEGWVRNLRGEPIAAATIDLYLVRPNKPERILKRLTTDPAGRFAGTVLNLGPQRVVASAAGYGFSTSELFLPYEDEGNVELHLTLPDELTIDGTIVTQEGEPVSGVEIRARKGVIEMTARSADDGRFTLGGLCEGVYSLKGRVPGWLQLEDWVAVAGERDRVFTITPPGRIEARVIDQRTRAPIHEFTYMVGIGPLDERSGRHLTLDPEGVFTAESIRPTEHAVVSVVSPGYVPWREDVVVESGATTELLIKLVPASRVLGQLIDAHGFPINGASIRLERLADPGERKRGSMQQVLNDRFLPIRLKTNARGLFASDVVEAGTFSLTVRHRSTVVHEIPRLIVHPGVERDLGTISLAGGGSIRGTLTLETGEHPRWANVSLERPGTDWERIGKFSSRTQEYEVSGIPLGTYRLHISYPIASGTRRFDAGEIVVASNGNQFFDVTLPAVEEP